MCRLRLFYLVVFLALYLPLEDFLLKWLPVSEIAFLALRQIPDLVVGALVLLVLLERSLRLRFFVSLGRTADVLLTLFVLWTAVAAFLNGADPAVYLIQTKGLLRYIVLMYTVVALAPSQSDTERFRRAIFAGVAFQILVGALQLAGGLPARDFLAPRDTTESVAGFVVSFTGQRFEGVNNLMGTMGNTINYAVFLLTGLCVWLAGQSGRGFGYWGKCSVFMTCIYLTGVRSAVVAAVWAIVLHQAWKLGFRRAAALVCSMLLGLGLVLASGLHNDESLRGTDGYSSRARFLYMFSGGYLDEAMTQRLGIAVYVLPEFFSGWRTVTGYSSDREIFVTHVRQLPRVPEALAFELPGIIEDVYWFAILFYYGVVGLLVLAGFLYVMYRRLRRLSNQPCLAPSERSLAVAAALMLAITVPLSFFSMALTIRQFSFYLWVLVGICIAQALRSLPSDKGSSHAHTAHPQ